MERFITSVRLLERLRLGVERPNVAPRLCCSLFLSDYPGRTSKESASLGMENTPRSRWTRSRQVGFGESGLLLLLSVDLHNSEHLDNNRYRRCF